LGDGRTVVSIVLSDDGKHILEGTWFNQPYAARAVFATVSSCRSAASRKWYRDHWQMSNPAAVQLLEKKARSGGAGVVPIYPLYRRLTPRAPSAVNPYRPGAPQP